MSSSMRRGARRRVWACTGEFLGATGSSLRPTGGFREGLGLTLFLAHDASDHIRFDVGLRASLADLRECTSSDCWPGFFRGGRVSFLVGGRRLKFGPAVTGGWIDEGGYATTFVASVTPLALSWTF